MKLLGLSLLLSFLSIVAGSANEFKKGSSQKKLYLQSNETFAKFKAAFTRQIMEREMSTAEKKAQLIEGLAETAGPEQVAQMLSSLQGPVDNPQVQLGKLAFMYEAMNRADLAAVKSLNEVCEVENLIDSNENSNICKTYGPYLLKLIELRISVITSRIIYSHGLIGIPKGWIDHVQAMVGDLESASLCNDSLKHLMYLLKGIAQNNEEIDTYLLPNLLSSRDFMPAHSAFYHPNQGLNTFAASSTPPRSAKITIDARNLAKEIRQQQSQEQHHLKHSNLDPMFSQLLPRMMLL